MRWDCGEHRVKIVEEGERGVAWGGIYPLLVHKRSLGAKMRFSDAITAQDGLEDVVVVTIPPKENILQLRADAFDSAIGGEESRCGETEKSSRMPDPSSFWVRDGGSCRVAGGGGGGRRGGRRRGGSPPSPRGPVSTLVTLRVTLRPKVEALHSGGARTKGEQVTVASHLSFFLSRET